MAAQEPMESMILAAYAAKEAADSGLPVLDICAAVGINPAILMDLDSRILTPTYQALLAEVVRQSGNELFWLRKINPEHLKARNLTWDYFFNAPDMREALRRSEFNYRLLSDIFFPGQVETEEGLLVRIATRKPGLQVSRYQVDWGLSQWYETLQIFAGPALKLLEVRLVRSDSLRQEAYRKFFKASVSMGQPFNELVFDREAIRLPNVRGDLTPALDSMLLTYLKSVIEKLSQEDPNKEAAYMAIQQQLMHGLPTVKNIAHRLGTSSRSLQRRLKDQGLTFKQLVTEARRYLAEYYLAQSRFNIAEIGLLLGFADHATMTKAFRKWHAMTPLEYRRKHRVQN